MVPETMNFSDCKAFHAVKMEVSGKRTLFFLAKWHMKLKDSLSQEQLYKLVEKQAIQLQAVNNTLAKVREEIGEELEMAQNVQFSLMPKELPDFINLSASAIYIPAGKVGGDFYDLMMTPSQKVAVLIFDVSGRGVPAALIGAVSKMLFAHYLEISDSPAEIFRRVNVKLCSYIKTDHYLTAFLGIIDPIRNVMRYARAGHVHPIVYHKRNKEVSCLDARGFFIGHSALAEIAEYAEQEVSFEPEDKILFYTDGLTEGANKKNELYGQDRLMQAVKKNGELPIDDLLKAVLSDQTTFREGALLRDDFTMLSIQLGDAESLLKESGFTKAEAPQILVIRETSEIERICPIILKAMDKYGFSDKEIKRTKLCIFELVSNSIIHAHYNDPKKRVLLLYTVSQEKVTLSIVDEGNGYDYANLPNPLAPENILKEHGRGVYIVRQFMDEVSHNEKGNRILIIKYHIEE